MDHITARRLAFVKYLWRRADESCDHPEPLSSVAVLWFHDAVELFLQLASEHLDVGAQQPGFMDYWDLIGRKLPDGLSQKESMRRLNKTRVALKHHGTMPSNLDIQSFRSAVRAFFDENTHRVFGRAFDSVSLTAFVDPEHVRQHLDEAIEHLEYNRIENSLEASASAFQLLLNHVDRVVANRWGLTPFGPRNSLQRFRHSFRNLDDKDGEFRMFTEAVLKSLDELFEAQRLMSLGIDYHRLLRFRQATPDVFQTGDGKLHLTWTRVAVSSPVLSVGLAQFAVDFVIDTALGLTNSSHIHGLFRGMELPLGTTQ